MSSYEQLINVLLKLQSCFKFQKLIEQDVVSKLDLMTKPRAGIALSVALWASDSLKRGQITYGDLIYIQRRLAAFLSKASKNEQLVLEKLLRLIPIKYGLDVETVAQRCFIESRMLLDIIRALNLLQEVVMLLKSGGVVEEPIKHERRLCLNDPELLPPAHANIDTYLTLIVQALNSVPELLKDNVASHAIELINDRIAKASITPSDAAAIALLALTLSKRIQNVTICVEPCIDLEALVRRVHNDLVSLGAEPSRSDIFELYRELLIKDVLRGRR
ncbi:MAG TPA: hypothetical protein EYH02_04610 [Ignisphaera aggregans]|uniref:Uncharacterized protein n=1 Tax=Ignisphaera aggregans TaxID=334771 RepID=A0A832Z052_9CREN|nr:hypothetical protein [Ignisphaera aggregans]